MTASPIVGIKQRLLAHLFRQAAESPQPAYLFIVIIFAFFILLLVPFTGLFEWIHFFLTYDSKALALFHQQFEQYASLTLWKMQLLDESHLLLKFGCPDVIQQRVSSHMKFRADYFTNQLSKQSQADLNNQTSFFVVYNMYSTEVIGVYENTNKVIT